VSPEASVLRGQDLLGREAVVYSTLDRLLPVEDSEAAVVEDYGSNIHQLKRTALTIEA